MTLRKASEKALDFAVNTLESTLNGIGITIFAVCAVVILLGVALYAVYELGRRAAFGDMKAERLQQRIEDEERLQKERERRLADTKEIIEAARRRSKQDDPVEVANKLIEE